MGMLLLASLVLASCIKDSDTSVETHSDTALTGITLGTLNRYTHTTSSKTGADTIIKTTVTGSSFKLTIDQLGRKVYNRDSLPAGTDMKHVTISALTTKNSGVAFIKSLTSDTLYYVRTTDSLDFSQPRTLRIVATNGSDYRDYMMTLSASSTRGTTFGWQLVRQDDALAGWTDKHLVQRGDTVELVDRDVIVIGKDLFTNRSSDIAHLLGATEHEMLAIGTDGRLKVCTDGTGLSWRDEQLDDSAGLLPTQAMAMTSWKYAPADSTDYILLVGNNDADGVNVTCWRKLSHYNGMGQPTEGTWVYMPVDGSNHYGLPRQDYLSLTYYNNNVLAIGSKMTLYQSRDQGITWKASGSYSLPSQTGGGKASIAADSKGRLWLLTDSGELWMGTLR